MSPEGNHRVRTSPAGESEDDRAPECDKLGARQGQEGCAGLFQAGRRPTQLPPTLGHQEQAPFHWAVRGKRVAASLPRLFVCKHLGCPQGAVLLPSAPLSPPLARVCGLPDISAAPFLHVLCHADTVSPRMQTPDLLQQMKYLQALPQFSCMPMAPDLPHASTDASPGSAGDAGASSQLQPGSAERCWAEARMEGNLGRFWKGSQGLL